MTQARRKALARARNMIRYYESQGYVLPKDDILAWSTQRLNKLTGRQLKKLSPVLPQKELDRRAREEAERAEKEVNRTVNRVLSSLRASGYTVPDRVAVRADLKAGKLNIYSLRQDIIKGLPDKEVGGIKISALEYEEFKRLRKESNMLAKKYGEQKEVNIENLQFKDIETFRRYRRRLENRADEGYREQRREQVAINFAVTLRKYKNLFGGRRAQSYFEVVNRLTTKEALELLSILTNDDSMQTINGTNVFYLESYSTRDLTIVMNHLVELGYLTENEEGVYELDKDFEESRKDKQRIGW